jgi:hypothetical protein
MEKREVSGSVLCQNSTLSEEEDEVNDLIKFSTRTTMRSNEENEKSQSSSEKQREREEALERKSTKDCVCVPHPHKEKFG